MIRHLVAAFLLLLALAPQAQAQAVRIMAAFTFKSALDNVVEVYKADGGGDVQPIYGPTPALAKQVENLAPADIFLSADPNWMNYLQDRGLIRSDSRVDLLTADLVLVTRSDDAAAPTAVAIGRDYPLAKIVGDGRVAMCNPEDHPAGRFGRAGLEGLGLWQYVAPKLALAESPPAAVALVARGEAPVAVVFSTDAKGVSGVKVAGVFPTNSHPPIVFPAAILRDSRTAETARFFSFLASQRAAAIFERFGYRLLTGAH
jgi:molybdate transport system substrate-binding protein